MTQSGAAALPPLPYAARTAGWDAQSLESSFCPTPEQLEALYLQPARAS